MGEVISGADKCEVDENCGADSNKNCGPVIENDGENCEDNRADTQGNDGDICEATRNYVADNCDKMNDVTRRVDNCGADVNCETDANCGADTKENCGPEIENDEVNESCGADICEYMSDVTSSEDKCVTEENCGHKKELWTCNWEG